MRVPQTSRSSAFLQHPQVLLSPQPGSASVASPSPWLQPYLPPLADLFPLIPISSSSCGSYTLFGFFYSVQHEANSSFRAACPWLCHTSSHAPVFLPNLQPPKPGCTRVCVVVRVCRQPEQRLTVSLDPGELPHFVTFCRFKICSGTGVVSWSSRVSCAAEDRHMLPKITCDRGVAETDLGEKNIQAHEADHQFCRTSFHLQTKPQNRAR